MKRRAFVSGVLAALVCGMLSAAPVAAQGPTPDPARFAADIDAFREWDTKNAVPADGVLFVGSSTIRLWPTATRFPTLPVINRGFGGSQFPDVNHYLDDLVLKYRPAVVVVYVGDNDINAGRTPQQVLDDYRTFVSRVLAARPDTRVVFLAIKPSIARWKLWSVMQQANQRVRSYMDGFNAERAGGPALYYADVATPMLTADGQTQADLYVDDGLHMTPKGYDLWTAILAPMLDTIRRR